MFVICALDKMSKHPSFILRDNLDYLFLILKFEFFWVSPFFLLFFSFFFLSESWHHWTFLIPLWQMGILQTPIFAYQRPLGYNVFYGTISSSSPYRSLGFAPEAFAFWPLVKCVILKILVLHHSTKRVMMFGFLKFKRRGCQMQDFMSVKFLITRTLKRNWKCQWGLLC